MRPVLYACMHEQMPSTEVRGAVTLSFDAAGRVHGAELVQAIGENGENGESESAEIDELEVMLCAEPLLASLVNVDAYDLTFTWPFVLVP